MDPFEPEVVFAGGYADEAPSVTGEPSGDAAASVFLLFAEIGVDLAPILDGDPTDRPRLRRFSGSDIADLQVVEDPRVLLTSRQGRPVIGHVVRPGAGGSEPGSSLGPLLGLRAIGPRLPCDEAALAARGAGLLGWHLRARFCPSCGSPTVPDETGSSRRCVGGDCGIRHFPRLDPTVITLPNDGDRCLLGRQSRFPAGLWSGFAGHVEAGETIEQASAREVFEEAGVRLDEVRYRLSQPWPFPHGLTFGCLGRVEAGQVPRADGSEIAEVRWFDRTEVASMIARAERDGELRLPGRISLAHQLAKLWLAEGDAQSKRDRSCS